MAKHLNPDINILKCAVPYFKYAEIPTYSQPLVVSMTTN